MSDIRAQGPQGTPIELRATRSGALRVAGKTVYTETVVVPGITAADALDANDALGIKFSFQVPYTGLLHSATFFDLDDEGSQVDVALFNAEPAGVANDAAFALTDVDLVKLVHVLEFDTFFDMVNGQMATVTNIGKAYVCPTGRLWAQCIARGTPNIAAGAMPRVRLEILSDD